jgi:DNA polymerase III sliding clamp (beta) subunit (PCNA family)
MTRVVFETATIAAVIRQAGKVAPSKGEAFDKAAGIVIDVPGALDEWEITVRATNLDVYRMEWTSALEISGEHATSWRVPTPIFATFINGLSIASGSKVIMEDKVEGPARILHVSQDKRRARFNLMDMTYYPVWEVFDPADLTSSLDVGGRISQVEWAAAKTGAPLSGVHFTGDDVMATDRYRLAHAPLSVPGVTTPVTVPAGILGSLLNQTGEVSIGLTESQMLLMPDEHTQIRCVLFGDPYPDLTKILSNKTYPNVVKLKKTPTLEVMNAIMAFGGADRLPVMDIHFGKEALVIKVEESGSALGADEIAVPGQCQHDRVLIKFTPKNLMDAIQNSPNETFDLHYNPEKIKGFILIDGGSGYTCRVMPRSDPPKEV